MKIQLEKEMETLLIPLYARAMMTQAGMANDTYALETLSKIEYDFAPLKIAKKLQIFMSIRSGLMDDATTAYLKQNPCATVISLGSGLDARYARLNGYGMWYDLDFPAVTQLRETLLPPSINHKTIASSVTALAWMDAIPLTHQPVLIVAEGLLMYLQEEDVKKFMERLCQKFSNITFLFDCYSKKAASMMKHQKSLKATGACIFFGVDTPHQIEQLVPSLRHIKTLYLTDEQYVKKLNWFYRTMFSFAGNFAVAKEAHRIFLYETQPPHKTETC